MGKEGVSGMSAWKGPLVLDVSKDGDAERLAKLKKQSTIRIRDNLKLIVEDLYDIRFPEQKDNRDDQKYKEFAEQFDDNYGRWVYYQWSQDLVRFPSPADYLSIRTSRNRNLITIDEQKELSKKTIFVAGLSVGSNVVESLVSHAIGGTLIMADLDILEPSNLNRIRAPFRDVGESKLESIARKVSEIDPFVHQVHFSQGVDDDVLKEVFAKYTPDIVVDEVDDLRIKLLIRVQSKKFNTPVVMATDNGDDILLDIERFDEDPDSPMLHGLIPQSIVDSVLNGPELPRAQLGMMIGKYFVGFENVPLRMFESLKEVGKTLPSWPQLGGAAALSGIMVAYAVRKIALDQPLKSGRHSFGPDKLLNPEIESDEYRKKLDNIIKTIDASG